MGEATEGGGNVDYQHLSTLLWREQELLDLLLFKAEEKQYLILTGKTRWLARIAHEIEVVLDQLRNLEVERAAATEALAAPAGRRVQPVPAATRRRRPRAVERPAGQAPRGSARPGHRPPQPVRRQPRADRGRPVRDRRRAADRADAVGRHVHAGRPRRRRHLPAGHAGRCPVSTFSGLNTATTALYAAQRAIDVTGQNVANVNTEGYSRQRVDLQSIGGSVVPAIWSTSNQVGQGVDSDSVIRIRDAFLEARAQAEHATTANLTVQSATLTSVEQSFQEPGATGIQSMLTNMWSGWERHRQPPDRPGRPRAAPAAHRDPRGRPALGERLPRQSVDEHPRQPADPARRRERLGQRRSPISTRPSSAPPRPGMPSQRAAGQARRPGPAPGRAASVRRPRPRSDGTLDVIVGGHHAGRRATRRSSSR